MKNIGLSLVAAAFFAVASPMAAHSATIILEGPGVVLSAEQPIQAIIIDSHGNMYQQTVYYNPSIGGIDIDTAWAGPNSSIYFPSLNFGYIWYNGNWVDQEGYYWRDNRRVYVNDPQWNTYWSGYWQDHDWRHWHHRDWRHRGLHDKNWHDRRWRGGEGNRSDWDRKWQRSEQQRAWQGGDRREGRGGDDGRRIGGGDGHRMNVGDGRRSGGDGHRMNVGDGRRSGGDGHRMNVGDGRRGGGGGGGRDRH